MTVFPAFENIKDNQNLNFQPAARYWTPSAGGGIKTAQHQEENYVTDLKIEVFCERRQLPPRLCKILGWAALVNQTFNWLQPVLESIRQASIRQGGWAARTWPPWGLRGSKHHLLVVPLELLSGLTLNLRIQGNSTWESNIWVHTKH